MTVTSGEMVKSFKGKYSEAIVVKNNEGGSKVLQLRVDDLSNMPLDMHILVGGDAVPGFPGYDQQHVAILEFDKDSKKAIVVENHQLTSIDGNKNAQAGKEEEN